MKKIEIRFFVIKGVCVCICMCMCVSYCNEGLIFADLLHIIIIFL